MNDSAEPPYLQRANALERAQAVSRALANAARQARFSTRARAAYQSGGFAARRGARAMRITSLVLFVLMAIAPTVTALVYFGFIASDQFVSEAKFTVGGGAAPKLDGIGAATGVPPMAIMQDTQIVTSYIESRALVELLERQVGLREVYSAPSIDWWARFAKHKPIEKFVDYWGKKAEATISFPSGIVTLTVRAFTPHDAKRIADAVVAQCETLINALNARMLKDTVLAAEQELRRAQEQLKRANLQLEQARNAEGVLDAGQTGASLSSLLSGLEADLLKAKEEYQTQLGYVAETAPQLRVLDSRIAALKEQIVQLKAQITAQSEASAKAQKALSGKMTKFARLDLEQKIAEKHYAGAAAELETARMQSERKMLYLHQIVSPALPEEARYPKRWLNIGMTAAASLLAWAATVGVILFVRNHMA